MGRPPIGKTAMTGAERTRLYRERLHASQPPPPPSPETQGLAKARARIIELERELQAVKKSAGAKPEPPPRSKPAAAKDASARAEPQVDPATLSMTAQQKLDAAIRQHKRQLDNEYVQRRRDEIRKALEDTILPEYNREREMYRETIKARKGIMARADFNKLRRCVHTDVVLDPILHALGAQDIEKARAIVEGLRPTLDAAFHLLERLKSRLLSEREDPTTFVPLPKTYADLMKMRQAASEARAAKRAGAMARRQRG